MPAPHQRNVPAHERLEKIEVLNGGDRRDVFRFVHARDTDSPALVKDFLSDSEKGKMPRGRAARIPELQTGLSVFRSEKLALARWRDIASTVGRRGGGALKIGSHIATLRLMPNLGISYEDLGHPDGHMTLWGNPELLASLVVKITPASD